MIEIFSSDSESSKWILDYDMWQGDMTTWSTFDWFTNLQKSRSAARVVYMFYCMPTEKQLEVWVSNYISRDAIIFIFINEI